MARHAAQLEGRLCELEGMVLDTDITSACFVISIADLEWPDLYENLHDLEKVKWSERPEDQFACLAAQLVHRNPLLVADWLVIQLRTFPNTIPKKDFPIYCNIAITILSLA